MTAPNERMDAEGLVATPAGGSAAALTVPPMDGRA